MDKTVGSSLTVLGSCRKTGVSLLERMGSLATESLTGPLSTFGESGLNVQSGHSEDLQGPSCAPLGLGSEEASIWIQTGLALTLFAFA